MTEKFIMAEVEEYYIQCLCEKADETQAELDALDAELKKLYAKRNKLERRLTRQQRTIRRVQKNGIDPSLLDEFELLAENMTA